MTDTSVPAAIVFDMDGTLVHTREAAWEVFREVNTTHGLGIDTRDAFFEIFEQDLRAGLAARCADAAQTDRVLDAFLSGLRDSYAPPFVPGMTHVVRTLAAQATLFVISGNAMSVVRRILERNGVATCFAHVFAGDIEPSKAVSLRRVLTDAAYLRPRRCAPDYVENGTPSPVGPDEVAIVTDTVGDVREARAHGIRAIGVSWGMHGQTDLLEAGAELVALWPEELLAALAGSPWLACDTPAGDRRTGATGSCATSGPPRGPATEAKAPHDGWVGARAAAAVRRRRRAAASGPGSAGAIPQGRPGTRPPIPAELRDAVTAILSSGALSGADEHRSRLSAPDVVYATATDRDDARTGVPPDRGEKEP